MEAKYYSKEIQKDKIRQFIGVIKDISENYFINDTSSINSQIRYNDLGAFFSASGFQEEAVNLAFVHGIKTISYRSNPIMGDIKDTIAKIEEGLPAKTTISRNKQTVFMQDFQNLLNDFDYNRLTFIERYKPENEIEYDLRDLANRLHRIKTSFFGMNSSGVLLHFIGESPFPNDLFRYTQV